MATELRKKQQNESKNRRRQWRRDNKLCIWCLEPSVEGFNKCDRHLERQREIQRKHKSNRSEWFNKGRCVSCHRKLHPYFDEGNRSCNRCNDH